MIWVLWLVFLPLISGSSAAPAVVIGELRCESRDEVVEIRNAGGAVSLAGWRLVSVVGWQEYEFGDVTLAPGASVFVHSGPDAPAPTERDRLWSLSYVWNNEGDEARLMDASGGLVSEAICP